MSHPNPRNQNNDSDQQHRQSYEYETDNSNDASFPHDYHDQYEDGGDTQLQQNQQQQQQQHEGAGTHDFEAGVQDVNFLLHALSMKAERPVLRLSQLSSSFFVLAFRQLFGEVPEGINISPQTVEDRVQNARAVIESIESKLDMSLAHISPELVATHDDMHISRLLRVFVDIVTAPDAMGSDEGDEYYEDGTGDGDQMTDEAINSSNQQHQQQRIHQYQHQQQSQQQSGRNTAVNSNRAGATSSMQANASSKAGNKTNPAAAPTAAKPGDQSNNKNNTGTAQPGNHNQATRVRDWLTSMYSNQQTNPNNNNNNNNNQDTHHHNENHPLYQQIFNDENYSYNEQGNNNNNNNNTSNNNNKQNVENGQKLNTQQQQQQQTQSNANYNNLNNNNNNQFQQDGTTTKNNNNSGNNTNANNNNHTNNFDQQQIERRVRRVADFIAGGNVPRYQTNICGRLCDGDGRYIRHFTGDGPLSTIGVATAQKRSTVTTGTAASMASRPLPAMSNARRDAKIERLRSEKFLQVAQDRAVREVVRQASREEIRMVQELKQQLREQRETFLSLDRLAKEKDHRLRQIYTDNVVSAVGATRNKNVKLNLHKNAADLVRRERAVVEREKEECEAEIRLQFEVLRAKREAYLSHLSSWRVAVMKQNPNSPATSGFAAAAPTSVPPLASTDEQRRQNNNDSPAVAGGDVAAAAASGRQQVNTSSRRPSSSARTPVVVA